MRKNSNCLIISLALFFICFSADGWCADYSCEVMDIKGEVYATKGHGPRGPVKQGDLLKVGDRIEVGEGGSVDLAYDKGWNNVTRIGENSDVTIQSIYPTGIKMRHGDIFAKLKKLPKKSTFEIETPICIAAVRGSVYRTTHEGVTHVYNFSPTPVEVFGLDQGGGLMGNPVILRNVEKTEVGNVGEAPHAAGRMSPDEMAQGQSLGSGIEAEVSRAQKENRAGQIQDISDVEKEYQKGLNRRIRGGSAAGAASGGSEQAMSQLEDKIERLQETVEAQTETKREEQNDKQSTAVKYETPGSKCVGTNC